MIADRVLPLFFVEFVLELVLEFDGTVILSDSFQ